MVELNAEGVGGSGNTGSGGTSGKNLGTESRDIVPFKLYVDTEEYGRENSLTFGPLIPPEDFEIRKDRDLNEEDGPCKGERVSDSGGQNREIHVSGVLNGSWEVMAFDDLLDCDVPLELDTMGAAWEGEIRVSNGNYHGPVGVDTRSGRQYQWKYTLELKSTGRDEYDNHSKTGILEHADNQE
jgi:hypothetical protein